MSADFKIKYDRNRFPMRQRRDDGTWGCRGCGGAIPKGRTAWCSSACNQKFNPSFVLFEVRKRDHDVCSECGFDCEKAYNEWQDRKWRGGPYEKRPPIAEYDHILPFSEGGLTVLENIRTLCSTCHRKRTARWHAERAARRNPQGVLFVA